MRPNFPCYELVGNGKLSDESCEKLSPAKCKYPQMTERSEVGRPVFIYLNIDNKAFVYTRPNKKVYTYVSGFFLPYPTFSCWP